MVRPLLVHCNSGVSPLLAKLSLRNRRRNIKKLTPEAGNALGRSNQVALNASKKSV